MTSSPGRSPEPSLEGVRLLDNPHPSDRPRPLRHRRATRSYTLGLPLLVLLGGVVLSLLTPVGPLQAFSTGSVPGPAVSDCPRLNLPTPICHVYILMDENQNWGWVMGHGPFQAHLAAKYAQADQYYSLMHYSFPNYLADTSGRATNYVHVISTSPPQTGDIVDLLNQHSPSLSWRAYMQSMPSPCDNRSTHQYKTAHNAFIMYSTIWNNQPVCKAHDVGFGPFDTLVAQKKWGQLPNYAWFSPNSTDDCWLSGEKSCDPWLKSWLSPLLNDSFFHSTAFFITYDESVKTDTSGINGGSGGGHIYTALVSPYACMGHKSATQYNDYNMLTTTEWLLGLGQLHSNDNWTQHPPMKDLFCFPQGGVPAGTGGVLAALHAHLDAYARRFAETVAPRW